MNGERQVASEGIDSFDPEEPASTDVTFVNLSFAIHSGTPTNPYCDRLVTFLCSQIRRSHVPQLPPGVLQLIGHFVISGSRAIPREGSSCDRINAHM